MAAAGRHPWLNVMPTYEVARLELIAYEFFEQARPRAPPPPYGW